MGFTIAPLQKRADQAGPVGSAAVFGPVDGAPPARGSPARDRLATPVRGRRDHHAAPTLVVTRTGSPPRTRSRARTDRPGTISLASQRLTAIAIRARLEAFAAALEVVLDEGLPARLEASGEPILERAAEQHAPQGSPSSPPIASTSRPNGSIAGPR